MDAKRVNPAWLLTVLLLPMIPGGPHTLAAPDPTRDVERALDQFHLAASRADAKTYFESFAPEGVFIGTDPGERWSLEAFKAYAMPFFAKGKGWTYTPRNRHVSLAPGGELAWFDELLDNATYGECRGTGVLRRIAGAWRVSQYSLSVPLPNALAGEVVEKIRHAKSR